MSFTHPEKDGDDNKRRWTNHPFWDVMGCGVEGLGCFTCIGFFVVVGVVVGVHW